MLLAARILPAGQVGGGKADGDCRTADQADQPVNNHSFPPFAGTDEPSAADTAGSDLLPPQDLPTFHIWFGC